MRVAPVLLLHARALLPGTPLRAPSVRMGWSDPDWKWGWGNGAAHDEAARVRAKLSTAPSRESFLFEVFAGVADVEDVKMALALKCQRARNRRLRGLLSRGTTLQNTTPASRCALARCNSRANGFSAWPSASDSLTNRTSATMPLPSATAACVCVLPISTSRTTATNAATSLAKFEVSTWLA